MMLYLTLSKNMCFFPLLPWESLIFCLFLGHPASVLRDNSGIAPGSLWVPGTIEGTKLRFGHLQGKHLTFFSNVFPANKSFCFV